MSRDSDPHEQHWRGLGGRSSCDVWSRYARQIVGRLVVVRGLDLILIGCGSSCLVGCSCFENTSFTDLRATTLGRVHRDTKSADESLLRA